MSNTFQVKFSGGHTNICGGQKHKQNVFTALLIAVNNVSNLDSTHLKFVVSDH